MIGAKTGIYAQSAAGVDGFLLDIFPNAAAAYSIRKLSSTYMGSCIRVRRSSDNAQQDIPFDINNELDQTSLLSFVGVNNGFVTIIYDQSGNGNDALQATQSAQPTIVQSGAINLLNGKPSIIAASGNQFLSSVSANEFIGINKNGSFAVGAFSLLNFGNQYVFGTAITTNRGFMLGTETSAAQARYHFSPISFGAVSGGTLSVDTQFILSGISTGSAGEIFVNNVSSGVDPTSYATGTPLSYFVLQLPTLTTGGARQFQEGVTYASDKTLDRNGINTNINKYFSTY